MNPKKYYLKYNLGGDSPLVRMNFLIPRTQFEKLLKLKNEEGLRINFVIQKAIEKSFRECQKEKCILNLWEVLMAHLVEEQLKQYHFSIFELDFIEHFNQFGMSVFEVAVQKGWWKKERIMGEAICLIHAEMSEWLEAIRKGNPPHSRLFDL